MKIRHAMICVLLGISSTVGSAQVILSGRLFGERFPGSGQDMPYSAVFVFANSIGPWNEADGFRTWETHPTGWFTLSGNAGNYTLAFVDPASFMRPIVHTNLYMDDGQKLDRVYRPDLEYSIYDESQWDETPATHYYQTFTAQGTSITHVGFKLATDGIDGIGPKSQNLLISIHRKGSGTPDEWPQVGPTALVMDVDCGGAKGYTYPAIWTSNEVPTKPGQTYAVHMQAQKEGNSFQTFWHADPEDKIPGNCYKIGEDGEGGWQDANMWMAIDGDSDGLVIPYAKRVNKKYLGFAGGAAKWSQTYIAKGKGLATVIMYAAVDGTQPPLRRQRARVSVREGGPTGPVVGTTKIAIGEGNYTGDASWGMFGATFAPGEVNLIPGMTYAIEFESIETYETLHGYVNIKGMESTGIPGFNPYKKVPPDDYASGTSYRDGSVAQDFDLDMLIVEYGSAAPSWGLALHEENLLANGSMEEGDLEAGEPAAWKQYKVDPGTQFAYVTDMARKGNRIIRVIGGGATGKTVDGGYVQQVSGLSKNETYRVTGMLRASWPVDEKHQCFIGYDPTGQTSSPEAETIEWTMLPSVHGIYVPYASEAIRPVDESISIWLRAKTSMKEDQPFRADFDDFTLQQVRTHVPGRQAQ
jgi:hypothetical protein